ncbi:MAG: tetratricopeptide repeat protein [Candidatus Acidiferrum sp.]
MNTPLTRSIRIVSFLCALLTMLAPRLLGQTGDKQSLPVIEGRVHDSRGRPIVGAVVSLESADPGHTLASATDSQGRFRFEAVSVGTYTVHTRLEGYLEGKEGPFVLHQREAKSVILLLTKAQATGTAKDESSAFEFSDKPTFTVAGVTDTTALGGHGSSRVLPSSNTLVKDAVSLVREGTSQPDAAPRDPEHAGASSEASIRAKLAQGDNADLHAQLAELEESEGHSLEAVKEYQRAAEMQPSEPHLFAWGAELLLHRAFEPSIEVFTKGRRLYPHSSRILLGLGAARFAQGSKEEAGQIFLEACDLNPTEPTPYLFLGRLQATENMEPPGWTERMKRFVGLHPESAMAHYFYAVALTKQIRNQENFEVAETELKTALELDPHLGNAYLQLGILRSERQDFPGAITAFQKAVETTPLPDEGHYRLAQLYRRMGEAEKAGKEIELFKQISEQKSKEAERERREIQQFVYTLRNTKPSSPPPVAPDSR